MRVFLVLAVYLTAAGCGSTEPTTPNAIRVDAAWVVGEAAASVDSRGFFRLSPFPAADGELSRDGAVGLAEAVIRHLDRAVGGGREQIEQEHGRPIDFKTLRTCGRVAPHWTHFADPSAATPRYIRTPLGNSYFIPFCTPSGAEAVNVEVLARTEARVAPDGGVIFPEPLGTEFVARGSPLQTSVDLSPEYAVSRAIATLGLRVKKVPELEGCLFQFGQCIGRTGLRWRLTMERSFQTRGPTGGVQETDLVIVQVGYGALVPGGVYVAAPAQPDSAWQLYDRIAGDGTLARDSVLLRLTRPIVLDPVEKID